MQYRKHLPIAQTYPHCRLWRTAHWVRGFSDRRDRNRRICQSFIYRDTALQRRRQAGCHGLCCNDFWCEGGQRKPIDISSFAQPYRKIPPKLPPRHGRLDYLTGRLCHRFASTLALPASVLGPVDRPPCSAGGSAHGGLPLRSCRHLAIALPRPPCLEHHQRLPSGHVVDSPLSRARAIAAECLLRLYPVGTGGSVGSRARSGPRCPWLLIERGPSGF